MKGSFTQGVVVLFDRTPSLGELALALRSREIVGRFDKDNWPFGGPSLLLPYRHNGNGPPAQELWCNVRMYNFPADDSWLLMDTVGMQQLDLTDHEACFARNHYEPGAVAAFLRNAADYVSDRGPVIRDGDTMDGPGGIRWRGTTVKNAFADPPREVIRWLPLDDAARPALLIQSLH